MPPRKAAERHNDSKNAFTLASGAQAPYAALLDDEPLWAECDGTEREPIPKECWPDYDSDSVEAPKMGKGKNQSSAFKKLVRLINARERSLGDARSRLRQSGYSQEVVDAALERAVKLGLLDDQRFAEGFIERKLLAGWGSTRIERELRSHGVATDCLPGYPEAYFDEQQQLAAALRALRKHRSSAKNQYQAKYRYLCQKGYSVGIVKTALQTSEQPDWQTEADNDDARSDCPLGGPPIPLHG